MTVMFPQNGIDLRSICAASKAGPCHPAPNGEGGVSAVETAVLHLNCLLSSGQGQGSRYTLFVPVPLPHSVCLSLWRPPFISPILNRVPLLVMFPISFFVPTHFHHYSENTLSETFNGELIDKSTSRHFSNPGRNR